MPSAYFAAPLFTDAERFWNADLVAALRQALPEWTWTVPQEFGAAYLGEQGMDYGAVYADCVAHLERASLVVAVLDGADADSGTAWEVGYACARACPVIGWRSDWRPGEDQGVNCMLARSCRRLVGDRATLLAAVAEIAEVR